MWKWLCIWVVSRDWKFYVHARKGLDCHEKTNKQTVKAILMRAQTEKRPLSSWRKPKWS